VAARPASDVPRTADIVFVRARVAVNLDGCFWHGCPDHGHTPRVNTPYWAHKIETNRERDVETDALLRDRGWLVLRFWEHEPREDVAAAIEAIVRGRS